MKNNISKRVALLVLLTLSIVNPNVIRGATHLVLLDNYNFIPTVANINVGDTVTWTNTVPTAHDSIEENFLWESPLLVLRQAFSFNFTQTGGYNYYCSPHDFLGMTGRVNVVSSGNLLPSINLTSPTNGGKLAADGFTLRAFASDSDGFVTNVQFYANTTLLGTATNSSATNKSFSLFVTNFSTGSYSFKAVAKDNIGATNTSPSANVTVVTPVNILLSSQTYSNGQFRFQYSVNPGLTYVVQGSTNLGVSTNFIPLQTNVPSSGQASYFENGTNKFRFYRVLRVK